MVVKICIQTWNLVFSRASCSKSTCDKGILPKTRRSLRHNWQEGEEPKKTWQWWSEPKAAKHSLSPRPSSWFPNVFQCAAETKVLKVKTRQIASIENKNSKKCDQNLISVIKRNPVRTAILTTDDGLDDQ